MRLSTFVAVCLLAAIGHHHAPAVLAAEKSTTTSASASTNLPSVEFLTQQARLLLKGCQVPAKDGTSLYTPDGKGNYKALWTRDFTYMVENAGDLMPPDQVEACIKYLIAGVRKDGAAPDRVRPDGVPVYAAGGEETPVGEPNIDNAQFLVIAADTFLNGLPKKDAPRRFLDWAPQLKMAMDYIPRDPSLGLVFNTPDKPHSPYGFTDCIGKTGCLLFESLLYWTACERLERWYRLAGEPDSARDFKKRARAIERAISTLWDEKSGAFLAATKDCRQIDIWGNAYAIWLDFPLGAKRASILAFLEREYPHYVWRGQVRHLLQGQNWQRLLVPVQPERYQNGAYWATASGWVMYAISKRNPNLARIMWNDLIADFQSGGICECVNEGYRQLPSYVASATNPLAAARRLRYR